MNFILPFYPFFISCISYPRIFIVAFCFLSRPYLDALRESGVTNMYGAVPYLQQEFPELSYDHAQAVYILREWMAHRQKGGDA